MKLPAMLLATLCTATGLILAQAPDMILYNGRIFTSDPQQLRVDALAIRGDRIFAVGTSDSMRLLAGAQTRLIDVSDRTVIPGFNDAHWHQAYRAPVVSFSVPAPPGLPADPAFEDVLTALAAAAATVPTDQVLQTTVGPRVMDNPAATRFELDRVAPDHR